MRLGIILLLVILSSCASRDRRNAEIYMKAKKYELAYPLWKNELRDNPEDAEVIVAVDICQREILNKKLITLRSLLESKKLDEALDTSWEIKSNVDDWGLKHDHDSSRFESRLNDRLFLMFASKVDFYLKNDHNLAALNLVRSNEALFNSKDQKRRLTNKEDAIKDGIKKKCFNYKTLKSNKPFYQLYTQRYCSLAGEEGRSISSAENPHQNNLYSDIKINMHVENLPHEVTAEFIGELRNSFKRSPWYHPDSTKIATGSLKGEYIRKYNSTASVKTHSYSVKVPYTAYQSVQKTKQVPYQTSRYKCRSVQARNQYGSIDYSVMPTQVCGNVTETAYKTEYYYVKEPYTAYRNVPKTYNYPIVYETQYLALIITGELSIGSLVKKISFNENISQQDYFSDTSLPDIGLHPHASTMIDQLSWIKGHLYPFQESASISYKELYKNYYCMVGNGNKNGAYINNIIACSRLGAERTVEVDYWFKDETGLSFVDANKFLGIY